MGHGGQAGDADAQRESEGGGGQDGFEESFDRCSTQNVMPMRGR